MAEEQTTTAPRLREQDLASKIAVVTGASKGIGRAIAVNLASRGCCILGTCSSPESLELFERLQKELLELYKSAPALRAPKVVGVVADVSSPDCPNIIARNLEEHFDGHVDIYINNASPRTIAKIGSLTPEHIQDYCLGNIQIPALIVDEMVKRKMFRRESRIIFISSARGRKASHKTPIYCVVKSAGESLVRCWAEAFGGKDPEFDFMAGTTANSLLVGLTKTDAIHRHGTAFLDAIQNEFLPHMSIPRLAEPEDVADVAGLLCSKDARWITGSVVSADGGGIKIL